MSVDERSEGGFEFQGAFYPWHIDDTGKDLMLIDRISGLPLSEFSEMAADPAQRGRAPIILTLFATSIRHRHPDWSVERIYALVANVKMSDFVTISVDEPDPDEAMLPPSVSRSTPPLSGEASSSPVNGSSRSSTPRAATTFEASSESLA
jgi:hypothetical protein